MNPEFIYNWQQLIGSALGPFLGVIFATSGFWLKSHVGKKREIREHLRRIEIALARSLNDQFDVLIELEAFIERIDSIVHSIKEVDGTTYCLQETNFAPMTDVFHEPDLPTFKIKSYYLHNKILFIDAGIRNTNLCLERLRSEYEGLKSKNEFMVAQKVPFTTQRESYIANLESFKRMLQGFSKYVVAGLKTVVQARVYSRKMNAKHRYFLWQNEGHSFKFYLHRRAIDAYHRELPAIDRIDKNIEELVKAELDAAKKMATEKYGEIPEIIRNLPPIAA